MCWVSKYRDVSEEQALKKRLSLGQLHVLCPLPSTLFQWLQLSQHQDQVLTPTVHLIYKNVFVYCYLWPDWKQTEHRVYVSIALYLQDSVWMIKKPLVHICLMNGVKKVNAQMSWRWCKQFIFQWLVQQFEELLVRKSPFCPWRRWDPPLRRIKRWYDRQLE